MPDTQSITTQPADPLVIPQGKLTFAAVNATLNGIATLLLLIGLVLIKQKKRIAHQNTMLAAFTVSAVFLVCYLTSKVLYNELTTQMVSAGHAPKWATTLYLAVLFPHLLAAIVMLPMIAKALYHAYHGQFDKHRKIARPTWAIWFYVSLSGVLVYWMLYHWLPSYR